LPFHDGSAEPVVGVGADDPLAGPPQLRFQERAKRLRPLVACSPEAVTMVTEND
jgi:hypothetical protein